MKAKTRTEVDPVYQSVVGLFYAEFKKRFGFNYQFTSIDGTHLKQIISKIKQVLKSKYGTEVSSEKVISSAKYFFTSIKDKFVCKNFTLPVINSQFNVLMIDVVESMKNDNFVCSVESKYESVAAALIELNKVKDNIFSTFELEMFLKAMIDEAFSVEYMKKKIESLKTFKYKITLNNFID